MAVSTYNFKINGLINPDNNILDNLNMIATASACWITFDAVNGLWSVIVNEEETPVAAFNDHNIIGGVSISGTGIAQLYNAVSVDFPHKDLTSQTDYIDISLDQSYWYPHEETNTMTLSFSIINDSIQAQYIGSSELKQSRCDKIVQFTTDYSMIGLKAGEVVSLTSEMYGFVNKPFRITKLEEDDAEDGTIQLRITAIEYDADVYSDTGFVAKTRTKKTGIVPKSLNTVVNQSDDDKIGNQVSNSTTGKNNLFELDDVQLTAPVTSGQALEYNGFFWVNAASSTTNLDDLGDVTLTTPLTNQVLSYDGTKWINVAFSSTGATHILKYSAPFYLVSDLVLNYYNTGITTFTIPSSGAYKCTALFSWYANPISVTPPLGVYKYYGIEVWRNGYLQVNDIYSIGSLYNSCDNADVYEDSTSTRYFLFTIGDVIEYKFFYKGNFSSGSYTVPSGYPSFSVPATAQQGVALVIDLVRIGDTL